MGEGPEGGEGPGALPALLSLLPEQALAWGLPHPEDRGQLTGPEVRGVRGGWGWG